MAQQGFAFLLVDDKWIEHGVLSGWRLHPRMDCWRGFLEHRDISFDVTHDERVQRPLQRAFKIHSRESRRPIHRIGAIRLSRFPTRTDRRSAVHGDELHPALPFAVWHQRTAGMRVIANAVLPNGHTRKLDQNLSHDGDQICKSVANSNSPRAVEGRDLIGNQRSRSSALGQSAWSAGFVIHTSAQRGKVGEPVKFDSPVSLRTSREQVVKCRPSVKTPHGTSARQFVKIESTFGAKKLCRVISRDILHFPARVLVIQAARGCSRAATLIPDTVLLIYSCGARFPVLPASPPDARARAPWSERRSALHGHAAASTDGHVSHDADRFASPRVRRAAAARDLRSAGTASPVPKYISSGVCPRNAECGSTRLCSST